MIAGAGSIGGGLARRYAEEGANVVLGDVALESAAAIVADIKNSGGKALVTQLDGADEQSAREAVSLACT